jgi:hypothetical protein
MIETALLILLGAFIGWNLPEPMWAKSIRNSISKYYNGVK